MRLDNVVQIFEKDLWVFKKVLISILEVLGVLEGVQKALKMLEGSLRSRNMLQKPMRTSLRGLKRSLNVS